MTVQPILKKQSVFNPETVIEKKDKSTKSDVKSKILIILGSIFFLIMVRFGNLYLNYFITQTEITRTTATKNINYHFIGFSNPTQAQEELLKRSPGKKNVGSYDVVCYFDLVYPSIFTFQSSSIYAAPSIDLGEIAVIPQTGVTTLKFSLDEFIEKDVDGKKSRMFRGNSPASRIFPPKISEEEQIHASFLLKEKASLKYHYIPYMIYFYVPLIVILILTATNSLFMLSSFLYYGGMLFLFDFQWAFVFGPFEWLYSILKLDIDVSIWNWVPWVMIFIFFLLSIIGVLSGWKRQSNRFKEIVNVITFILLPLCLRF